MANQKGTTKQKGVKSMIPNGSKNAGDKKRDKILELANQRQVQSQERVKLIYKGLMEGIGSAIEEMEKDPKIGAPTFYEMTEAITRAAYDYNNRALQDQWKNIEIVDAKQK